MHLLTNKGVKVQKEELSIDELHKMITPYDIGRLKSFTNNMVEYRLILDTVPTLARLFFLFEAGGLHQLSLSPIQRGILIGLGLQFKSVDTLATELDLDGKQLLGKFRDMMRQIVGAIKKTKSDAIKNRILAENGKTTEDFRPMAPLTDELDEAAKDMQQKTKERLLTGDLSQYKVKGSEDVWNSVLAQSKGNLNLVSVQTGEKRSGDQVADSPATKKKMKNKKEHHSNKKQKKMKH